MFLKRDFNKILNEESLALAIFFVLRNQPKSMKKRLIGIHILFALLLTNSIFLSILSVGKWENPTEQKEECFMLTELRNKAQITIPKEIVTSLGLSEGDKLDIFEKDGMICIMPVVVYPKDYVDTLHQEIKELKENIAKGKKPIFDSIDALFDKLENNE